MFNEEVIIMTFRQLRDALLFIKNKPDLNVFLQFKNSEDAIKTGLVINSHYDENTKIDIIILTSVNNFTSQNCADIYDSIALYDNIGVDNSTEIVVSVDGEIYDICGYHVDVFGTCKSGLYLVLNKNEIYTEQLLTATVNGIVFEGCIDTLFRFSDNVTELIEPFTVQLQQNDSVVATVEKVQKLYTARIREINIIINPITNKRYIVLPCKYQYKLNKGDGCVVLKYT